MKLFLLLLAFWASNVQALFEDQVFKFDWRHQFVGAAEDAVLVTASKSKDLVVVRTSSDVIAALNGDNGRILWRQVFADNEKLLDISLKGKILTSLSFDSRDNATFIRTWNALNGALSDERRISTALPDDQNIQAGFLFDNTPHLVHLNEHNGLKIHAVYDNDEKIQHSFSTGAGSDKHGFSCLSLSDSYVCASAMLATVYSTKLPLSGNTMNMASLGSLGVTEPIYQGNFIKTRLCNL